MNSNKRSFSSSKKAMSKIREEWRWTLFWHISKWLYTIESQKVNLKVRIIFYEWALSMCKNKNWFRFGLIPDENNENKKTVFIMNEIEQILFWWTDVIKIGNNIF